ncbi:MAG: hypothetical protein ACLFTE_09235, partial [Salinivenus sp.]
TRQTAYRLSVLVVVLMATTAGLGLFSHSLYRDNALVAAGWYGNDLVTLVVAVPLLTIALAGAWRGSDRATLVWLGLLSYTVYNYAFYLFGAAFNSLFLLYTALFTLSGAALIFGLASLDVRRLHGQVSEALPVGRVATFMALVGGSLGGFYVVQSLDYLETGTLPAPIDATGLHTHLIAALDLSTVVPVALLGAAWLWQGEPWGYVLAALWSVKGTVYMMTLAAATLTSLWVGSSGAWELLPLWAAIGVGCGGAARVLLSHLRPARSSHPR